MESTKGLEQLRGDLDLIDERLLDALRARIECCVRIAQYKREHDIPMMQPHRINFVQERAAQYATQHNIDHAFLRNLYELVIAETCRVEELVMSGSGQ